MPVWNVFDQDAFSLQTLTAEINNLPFTPTMIGGMNLFEEEGVATLSALIDEINDTVALLSPKPRHAPGHVVNGDKGKVHSISIPHIPERAAIFADSVQGVRELGSETNTKTVESERNARLRKMRRQIDYAVEYHRLLVLQGSYMDVNGAIQSAYTLFGAGSRTSVDFLLGTATTKVREKCIEVTEAVESALGGVGYTGVEVLCSTGFWKKLITHPKVEETYLNTSMAAALREGLLGTMEFGDITWRRYRGTSAVKVPDGKGLVYPVGVPGMYMTRFAPAPYIETVNTTGLPYYAKSKVMDFDRGLELEAQSNPLNLCLRPAALIEVTSSN